MMKFTAPLTAALLMASTFWPTSAADAEPPSAKEIAGHLSTMQEDGSSTIRLRLTAATPPDTKNSVLQIQILQRRNPGTTDVIYRILWPKDRQGESVLLKKKGDQAPAGTHFIPPETAKSLGPNQMKDPVFGSDLAYADLIENFYAWDSQAIVGEGVVGRVNCQILESKPGSGQSSIYASVRSWVDIDRMVPLRVEKFLSPVKPVRRIETTRITKEADGHHIPASLSVRDLRKTSLTELEGSRLNERVQHEDQDFTLEAIKEFRKVP